MKIVTGFVVIFAVLVGIVASFVRSMPETQEILEFEKKFQLVKIGDPESKALVALGVPDVREKEFHLGQRNGFEAAYSRAESSDPAYYLFWFKGIDAVFAIGINKEGKVSVKESGGT